ncbi:MAG: MurR/RpiR family transcriptional regulator [Trueperaceae bacterium]|nr:MurR/RpiR family transcriptional regulator [Trueperaceae bacterium]MCC6310295.1 MurR/RpiR family transcriptional regulator [Trueperaceae bacterium]MCO5173295.1 MurR/RpiR family transcriptional regulator [Trueperaceae bacterium]MCW5818744.1 MurR/RpiR family transcriptional regulator [Trueperaceae bacterium]
MTVIDQIREHYPALSPTEQRIARHYLQHGRVMVFASASQVARRLGISTSTIVRFAQQLGYSGYVELQERMQSEYDAARRLVSVKVAREDLIEHVVRQDAENIASVLRNEEALISAGIALANAPRVWVTGSRSSGDLASIAWRLLNMVRPNVTLLDPNAADVADRIMDLEPEDVLLVFSMSRYAQEMVQLVELAPPRAGTVLVTDEHVSPLLPFADWPISVATQPAAMFRSLTAVMTALQALVAATAREIGDEQVDARLAKAEEFWARFGTFSSHLGRR